MPMRREDCLDVSAVTPRALNSGFMPGATARNLSTESKTGGEHLVMELPAGWSLPRGRNEADIDLYVLEGSLEIGGENWMQGCYGYFPAGMAWGPLQTSGGCRLLLFTSRPLTFEEAGDSLADAHVERHIARTNTWHLPWVDPMADIVKRSTWKDPNTGQEARPPGVLTKGLRKDDGTKEVIALTALAPGFVDPGTEHHPHNECLYLIAGRLLHRLHLRPQARGREGRPRADQGPLHRPSARRAPRPGVQHQRRVLADLPGRLLHRHLRQGGRLGSARQQLLRQRLLPLALRHAPAALMRQMSLSRQCV